MTGPVLYTDVVVIGYGYSGAMTALAAAGAGAKVLLLEKQPQPGGNSVMSGGSCVYGTDLEETLKYLRATTDGSTPEPILRRMAEGMVELPSLVERIGSATGCDVVRERRQGAYAFPGARQLGSIRLSRPPGYTPPAGVAGSRAGATLFSALASLISANKRISVRASARAVSLIRESHEVIGCEVVMDGRRVRIFATRGVALCTGGFERNARVIREMYTTANVGTVGSRGNTGDGLVLGQSVGADVWHMAVVHGSYGFRVGPHGTVVRHAVAGPRSEEKPMPWIIVDRTGRRFMNEYPPAPQDTPIRELLRFDTDRLHYAGDGAHLILDKSGLALGPLGRPVANDRADHYEWSEDNSRELRSGLIRQFDTLQATAEGIGVSPNVLLTTIKQWNTAIRTGDADNYQRPGWSRLPITQPPYYAVPIIPVITNTQGGLVHDENQRVLDARRQPVPRLFKAGENGSIFGHLYLLGGNNTECLVGGQIAGQAAANMRPRFSEEGVS